jgi:large subunit ribosomal protein L11
MSKAIKAKVKIQLVGGGANPSQIGKEMGPHGINLMKFCTDFNAETASKKGEMCPAEVTVFVDKTYKIVIKTPPTSYLLKKAARIEKGSSSKKMIAGKVTKEQILSIAKIKLVDLNTMSLEQACKSVEGTAASMRIEVVGVN